ncbi:hypothetical protein HMP0721_1252 [Pseudoramibacter alactolyticus ATCC 23263]|jgi:hypothetical protein|uniref:Uncharacterized protein n=1 Tax=Pseudoramibacter alactolyticus ATCC 23263 TaxID=887929 RepID=E6MGW8_9FIRM|nr:hypothetical protein [Pseudoramibacter alactolyticus]EFV01858.1 hypothetical protein HMP0721_1252 [Pseudoramibacter alactolyticus ATCC 23263]
MTDPIVTAAIVSGVCVAVPTIITTLVNNSAHNKVIDERMKLTSEKIEELSERMNKHNNLIERMAIVERDLKTAWRQIDDIKEEKK